MFTVRAPHLIAIAMLALVSACGGGGSSGGTDPNNPPPGPQACSLDSQCGSRHICEGGFCAAVNDDGTDPVVVAYGPRSLRDVSIQEPLWFTFSEPMRIAPGGFSLYDPNGRRYFEATAELSLDQRTLTLHPVGVFAPLETWLSLPHVTDLTGNVAQNDDFTITYPSWRPLAYHVTEPQTEYAASIAISVDGSGGILAAWHAGTAATPTREDVFVKRWNGTAWADLGVVNSEATLPATYPQLASSDGTSAVAFTQTTLSGDKQVVRTWTEADGWSAPLGGAVDTALWMGPRALAVASTGKPVIAYTVAGTAGQGTQLVVKRWDGASWAQLGSGALNVTASISAEERVSLGVRPPA